MTKASIALFGLLVLATIVHALEMSAVENFFQNYQEFQQAFDPEIASLYSDEARIRITHVYADGDTESMTITGARFKSDISRVMRSAAAAGDVSKYTSVRINIDGNHAIIQAIRFAVLQNYSDVTYKMVIEQKENGLIQIIEEHKRVQQ